MMNVMRKILLLVLFSVLPFLGACEKPSSGLNLSGISSPVSGRITWSDGAPAVGIQVSDGFTIVRTDKDGNYKIPKRNTYAYWVYYSIPADAEIAVGENGLPLFAQKLDPKKTEYNFSLKKIAVEKKFRLLALGDPQGKEKNNGIGRFNAETAPDIREYVAGKSGDMPTYAVTLGDLVHNEWNLYPEVTKMLSLENLSVPCFQVIGNHDHEFSASDPIPDLVGQRKFEAAMGPVNYSFDRGDVHILVLDNIVHQGKSETSCKEELCERVMEWARTDLSAVPKEKTVVVCMHAGLEYAAAQELYEILAGFNYARLIGGHSHYIHYAIEKVAGKTINMDDVGTTNGVDWCATVCGGGEPMGYASYEFEDGKLKSHIYKAVGHPETYQIRLYHPADFPEFEYQVKNDKPRIYKFDVPGNDYVVANIWNATTEWSFEVWEDGVKVSDALVQKKMYDAWSCWYFYKVLARNTYSYSRKPHHMYYHKLHNPGASDIKVVARDPYGHTFEQTVFTTRAETDYPAPPVH